MAEMKHVVFGEGLMVQVVQHLADEFKKKITIRLYRPESHAFRAGDLVIGEFKDGLDILLRITHDTETKAFRDISDAEAQEDGFENAAMLFAEFRETWYRDKNLQPTDTAAIIRFEVYTVGTTPVVALNEHA